MKDNPIIGGLKLYFSIELFFSPEQLTLKKAVFI